MTQKEVQGSGGERRRESEREKDITKRMENIFIYIHTKMYT